MALPQSELTDAQRAAKFEQAWRILLSGAVDLQACIDNYDPSGCRFCRVIAFVQLRLIGRAQ